MLEVVSFEPHNCANPGDYSVEYEPGQVRVYLHHLVSSPAGGCPARPYPSIEDKIPLDQLVNGDEIFLNDEFMFHATNLFCRDQNPQLCPVGCESDCAQSAHVPSCTLICVPPMRWIGD